MSGAVSSPGDINDVTGALRIAGANIPVGAAAGNVLTSDANGNLSLKSPSAYAATLTVPQPAGVAAADTAAIQNAENALAALGGGRLLFSPGTYVVTGLTKQALTYWQGAGIAATVLKLAAGSNADVVQGAGFGSLTLGGASTWGVSGIFDFGISAMTIDGNASAQTGTSYGIRLYGYQWTFRDLSVRNCLTTGIWTEWGPLSSNAPVTSNGSESTAVNVKVFLNGVHGWQHLGPSDARMHNVLTFENNQSAGASGIGFWALNDQVGNVMSTASAVNGTNASGFTGTFTVQAAQYGGATDLYAPSGTLSVATSSGTATMTYTGKTATTLTGCVVTSGSGTFQTGNAVTTAAAKFTVNGLQLTACHSWSNNHTWAAVLDGQVTDAACHWEGAQYGQLLVRNATNKAGGFLYDYTLTASGCGVQLGDAGSTPGVPLSAQVKANSCDIRIRVSSILMDTAARSAVNWVSCSQSSVDVLAVAKTAGTFATTLASGSNGVDLSTFTSGSPGTLFVASTQNIPNGAGSVTVATALGTVTCTFTGTNGSNGGSQGGQGRTAGTQITGVAATGTSGSGYTMSTGGAVALAGIGSVGVGGAVDAGSRVRVQAQSSGTALSTAASAVQEYGPHILDVGTAANGWQLRTNGTQYANYNGSAKQMQYPNGTDLRGYSDNYVTKTWEVPGATGIGSFAAVAPTGLTGAVSASRYAGAIASGAAPASGTFIAGDFLIVLTGGIIICTAGGTPGTWASLVPATAYAAPVSYTPANPTATASAALVMMGLGSACAYTPAATGKVLATFCGLCMNTTGGDSLNLVGAYGTGTAPANGAAVSGTLWGAGTGASLHIKSAGATIGTTFSFTQILSLTPAAAYWLDVQLSTDGAGTAEITNVTGTFAEIP